MSTEPMLDQLLHASGAVHEPSPDAISTAREAVTDQAAAAADRAAKIVRLRRRHRRLTIGVAAAAIAGMVAVPLLSRSETATPPTAIDTGHGPTPVVQEHFTTVAQVTNAAAKSSGAIDPTANPYWKVVTQWDCDTGTCTDTMWNGIGRPGVMEFNGGSQEIPEASVTIAGKRVTWAQVNKQKWTDAQIYSMVADSGTVGKPDRAPSSFYVFKEAIGLLTYAPASPTIRQQLWRQLAKIPGVTFDGQAKDALGRTGWRLTLDTPGWARQSVTIDAKTGMPLEGSTQAPGSATSDATTVVSASGSATAPNAMSNEEAAQKRADAMRKCGLADASSGVSPESVDSDMSDRALQPMEGRMPVDREKQVCLAHHLQGVPMPYIGD